MEERDSEVKNGREDRENRDAAQITERNPGLQPWDIFKKLHRSTSDEGVAIIHRSGLEYYLHCNPEAQVQMGRKL